LSQTFLFLQEFLHYFCLESGCILFPHHALVYLISGPFPVQISGSIIRELLINLKRHDSEKGRSYRLELSAKLGESMTADFRGAATLLGDGLRF